MNDMLSKRNSEQFLSSDAHICPSHLRLNESFAWGLTPYAFEAQVHDSRLNIATWAYAYQIIDGVEAQMNKVEPQVIGGWAEPTIIDGVEHIWFNQREALIAAFDNTMLDSVNNVMLNRQSLVTQLK